MIQLLNSLLVNVTRFLGAAETFTWNGREVNVKFKFLETICDNIEGALWPILVVVLTVGCIYAIWLGIKMAKADESGKREEARKNVINTVVAMAIVFVLIILIQLVVIPNISTWIS